MEIDYVEISKKEIEECIKERNRIEKDVQELTNKIGRLL